MEYKELFDGTKIPVLGQGTWKMVDLFPDPTLDKRAIESLKEGIKLGMTHIDTAEVYAAGHAEEIIAKTIKPFDREKLFITTKVWRTNLRYDNIIKAMKGSLKRLKLKYIDLYLVHFPVPDVPLKEIMEAMEYLAEEGKTRYIGVSNFSLKQMKEAQSYLKKYKIVTNQVRYNLLYREPERGLLPYCQKNKIILIAYTPLETGRLAKPGIKVLDQIAKKYNKTQAQVALNWLISKENVITITKASKVEHVRDVIGAVGWRLGEKDMKRLDKLKVRASR